MNLSVTIDFNSYLREVCAADLLANSMQIGGSNMTAEVDESLFTRRNKHQGCVLRNSYLEDGVVKQKNVLCTPFLTVVPQRCYPLSRQPSDQEQRLCLICGRRMLVALQP